MNKSAIKKYAVWARNELIDRVKRRAALYEISDKGYGNADADSVLGRPMSDEEKQQRKALIARIDKNGYEFVIEEVAYTWFNRFAALRFMEVNGCLPSRVRVFTDEDNTFKPQILTEAINLDGILDGLDMQRVYELKNEDNKDALFKYLIIVQCNALSRILPGMFQKINDYTELLFPDNLLREGSAIQRMIEWIPEDNWTDQVQIIGWLYQYYNTEPKDKVFSRPSGQKITKQEIPAATQLFTPHWIVRYMVENSLGRLWLDHCKAESGLSKEYMNGSYFEWTYYLEEAEQEPEVEKQLEAIRKENASLKPEDIRVIDPCMGSGHILCYLFDVLVQIYESYGYPAREAVRLILEKNLYGLDLDERAQQLAYFALMMKAWRYDHRFFSRNKDENGDPIVPQPHLGHFQDLSLKPENFSDPALQSLVKAFENADEYGSLLEINDLDIEAADYAVDAYTDNFLIGLDAREKLLRMVKLAWVLSQKYDVVVTNPPYMGGGMDDILSRFVKKKYPDSKSDLFAVFIEKCGAMTKADGYYAMITQHAWMFLSSYEKLRGKLQTVDTVNMAHLGARAFEEIGGEVVQTTAFVNVNRHTEQYKGIYCRLIEPTTQNGKEEMFLSGENRYFAEKDNFAKIPGAPVAYWVSSSWFTVFENYPVMRDRCVLKKGTSTGDNKRFIRQWYEVNKGNIFFEAHTPDEAMQSKKRWFPINGGGERRKWYGNRIEIVNWESDGKEMKSLATKLNHGGHWSRYIINPDRFFTECIGWSAISSSKISARYIGYGFAFSSAAMEAFEANLKYLMALINSVVADDILDLLAPTLNFGVEQIGKIPLILVRVENITEITEQNISLSRADWDSFETSWDFKKHPLMRGRSLCTVASRVQRPLPPTQSQRGRTQPHFHRHLRLAGRTHPRS